MDVGRLIRGIRESSGLSVRAWATPASVAGSTITRIQAGEVDPSVGTIRRLCDAAGYELRIEVIDRRAVQMSALADLADAWGRHRKQLRLDWTRWRLLLDELALHPERVPEAIYRPPWPSGEPVVDALLAAVAEKLADDAGLPHPTWAETVPPLDAPFRPPVPRSVPDRAAPPPQLARRGLMIDAESLWRRPETIGA